MKIAHKSNYRERRRPEYPPVADQLDAVYKLTKALQAQGIELPADVAAWVSQIDNVKETFPKGN